MNTAAIKSIYVTAYRWNARNFGQGGLPKFNSLFGVSFLLILLLTNLLMFTQLCLHQKWFNINQVTATVMLLAASGALLLNYFILLNNGRFKKWNIAFEKLSKNNQKAWSIMLMAYAVVSCVFFLFVNAF
jgi:Co/Zn/Cd efflux system component